MPDGALGGVNKNGFGVLPYFKEEEFLREWIYQGVRINIIVNGKPHEFHTLAAIDGKKRAVEPLHTGDFDPNGSGGTFFFRWQGDRQGIWRDSVNVRSSMDGRESVRDLPLR